MERRGPSQGNNSYRGAEVKLLGLFVFYTDTDTRLFRIRGPSSISHRARVQARVWGRAGREASRVKLVCVGGREGGSAATSASRGATLASRASTNIQNGAGAAPAHALHASVLPAFTPATPPCPLHATRPRSLTLGTAKFYLRDRWLLKTSGRVI